MATVILAAAGAAVGGSVGGTLAGISSVAIGRLVGATAGRLIDQRLMGGGSDVVDSGKVERFRMTGSAEGSAISRLYGRTRVAGHVIWATRFQEHVTVTGGGKGAPSQPKTREHSYSVSLAIALCEGEITRVGRIWADGIEVSPEDLDMRVHLGTQDQMPDAKMEAVEGKGSVPAYRGTAYVVFEDLDLARFGNRVPQFTFEVMRLTPEDQPEVQSDYAKSVRAVALVPGTGEYALATTPVFYRKSVGEEWSANENSPAGKTDFAASLEALGEELPNCGAASLVVSWFGNDLRAGQCELRPKVESHDADGRNMPWLVSGLVRTNAQTIAQQDGRPIYGGTPADTAVVEAIVHMKGAGQDVMFYPFILMEQLADNGLPDPWSDATDQPVLPWRGRITSSVAAGRDNTPDGTSVADEEVAAFIGTATAGDFAVMDGAVQYTGPDEWRYRRFVLHYAALCAAAGGVAAFCIGSEMRGLTQIRGESGFPAVEALRDLAAEVRILLGPETKIGYAADWSEYFGYHPQDGTGDVYFHLDPLWADSEIDFVGIDNYMPLSDWRGGRDHIDAEHWKGPHDIEYLMANIEGGEGYEWYYSSQTARDAQRRQVISDDAYGEPWVYRYKDLRSWWKTAHHNRVDGTRLATPTPWEPQSKPIWFTEIGCAAIDKGTNQPNVFHDERSSESALPFYSNGARDDAMQQAYLEAMQRYWSNAANNPVSGTYGAAMIDMSRSFVWAWDTRPFPFFPNNRSLWSDGGNHARGHWINGRSGNRTLASVVAEICRAAGVSHFDVSDLRGVVRGYEETEVSDGRAALQPLMLRYGFDALEREGQLVFAMRGDKATVALDEAECAVSSELEGNLEKQRAPDAEISGRVRLGFLEAGRDYGAMAEEAILPGEQSFAVTQSELPLVMTRAEGRQTAERWLAEARVARDGVKFSLPPSRLHIGVGDMVSFDSADAPEECYRIDRLTQSGVQVIEAARQEDTIYDIAPLPDDDPRSSPFVAPVPVQSLFLDLPLIRGTEAAHAPHLAVTARPWPGSVAVYESDADEGYALNTVLNGAAVIGVTQSALGTAPSGRVDRGTALEIRVLNGELESVGDVALLNGGNLFAIGDGSADNWELFQAQSVNAVGDRRYMLEHRLRGQLGTEQSEAHVWPVGSWVVAIDAAVRQLDIAATLRHVARHYRIGAAGRAMSDPSYSHHVHAFAGMGLRPYAPVHLKARADGLGGLDISWTRRTRIDGDPWDAVEVPLGEDSEQYLIRVCKGQQVLREVTVSAPVWSYPASDLSSDLAAGGDRLQIAQLSMRFGAGKFAALALPQM